MYVAYIFSDYLIILRHIARTLGSVHAEMLYDVMSFLFVGLSVKTSLLFCSLCFASVEQTAIAICFCIIHCEPKKGSSTFMIITLENLDGF